MSKITFKYISKIVKNDERELLKFTPQNGKVSDWVREKVLKWGRREKWSQNEWCDTSW